MALEVLEYSAHLIWTTFIMAFWSFTDIMNLMYGKKSGVKRFFFFFYTFKENINILTKIISVQVNVKKEIEKHLIYRHFY